MEPASSADELLAGWELVPLVIDGVERGGAILAGTEIHFALAPEWRGRSFTTARVREFLTPLVDRLGFLTTRAPTDAGRHRFLSRLGFERTWSASGVDHYMLCNAPFGR